MITTKSCDHAPFSWGFEPKVWNAALVGDFRGGLCFRLLGIYRWEKHFALEERFGDDFVQTSAEGLQPPNAFQAEYEGSIPFTRSIFFDDLACEGSLLPTKPG